MEFCIERCAMLVMKNDNQHSTEGVELYKSSSERLEKRKPKNTWDIGS